MRSAICLSVELVYRVSSEKRLVSGPNDVAAGPAEDPLSWLRRVGAAPRRLKRPQAGASRYAVASYCVDQAASCKHIEMTGGFS